MPVGPAEPVAPAAPVGTDTLNVWLSVQLTNLHMRVRHAVCPAVLVLVQHLLQRNVGTGAGWVKQRLHLCLPDAAARDKARAFIRSIIDFAGPHHAPAIIGSMQGRSGDGLMLAFRRPSDAA